MNHGEGRERCFEVFWCSVSGQKYIFQVNSMKHYANHMLEVTFFSEHSALSVSAWEEVKAISAVQIQSQTRHALPCSSADGNKTGSCIQADLFGVAEERTKLTYWHDFRALIPYVHSPL